MMQQTLKTKSDVDYNQLIKYQDILIEERHQEIIQLAEDQQQINDMMKTISNITEEQGFIVDDIRRNIKESCQNVDDGKKDLEKAEKQQEHNNWLTIIIASITTGVVAISAAVVALVI
jgi:t-SNARE complex subunit (syntaxin)